MDGQICRLFTFENATNVSTGVTVGFCLISSVTHQTTGLDKGAILENCRHCRAQCTCCQLTTPVEEKGICADHKPTYFLFGQASKSCIQFAFGACFQDMQL